MNATEMQLQFIHNPPPFSTEEYAVVALSAVFCFLGALVNGCLFYALYQTGMTRQYVFNLNMAISDCIVCCYKLVIHLGELFHGRLWGGFVQCQIQGFLEQTCWAVCVVSVAAITIDPYRIVILKANPMSRKAVTTLLVTIWVVPGLMPSIIPLLPIPGSSPFEYHSSGLYSVLPYRLRDGWIMALSIIDAFVLIVNPITILFFFSRTADGINKLQATTAAMSARTSHIQRQVIKRGQILAATHLFSWSFTAFSITYEVVTGDWLPVWADRMNYLLPLASCALNPMICFFLEPRITAPIYGLFADIQIWKPKEESLEMDRRVSQRSKSITLPDSDLSY
ncbi:hypothetical protein HDU91_005036 [Kappamyces sp. JEL0680]|nr:hypothetical protein HDU91_005036 [Kappamyces sp. JEL0680]